VIGGGNSAMDAARTAKRLVGPKGRVSIVYRRTMSEMPADLEEVQGALEEGVELLELCAPEQVLIEPDRISGSGMRPHGARRGRCQRQAPAYKSAGLRIHP
jgi:putative selenate reductase